MKVAVIHSFYESRQPSGENAVVAAQVRALSDAGHQVELIALHTDMERERVAYPLRAAWRVASGYGPSPIEQLTQVQPDIVHVHNLFPNFGTKWLRDWNGPIVATVHNYRAACAAGTFFRDGHPCFECIDQGSQQAVRHGCYRGSMKASLPLAIANRRGAAGDPLLNRADKIIALSDLSRTTLERIGVDPTKTCLVPNFVPDTHQHRLARQNSYQRNGWIYVGRLSEEKGIAQLVENWPADRQLDVYGDGPLMEFLTGVAGPHIEFHGNVERATVDVVMARAVGLVFPSEWMEAAPMVYVESLRSKLPVVARTGNSVAADVLDNATGVTFNEYEELPKCLAELEADYKMYAHQCEQRYLATFTTQAWVEAIERTYRETISGKVS